MAKPRIGITTYGNLENNQHHLPSEYAEAVLQAGGSPFLIPPLPLDLPLPFDGIILAGGGDIHPQHYSDHWHQSIRPSAKLNTGRAYARL